MANKNAQKNSPFKKGHKLSAVKKTIMPKWIKEKRAENIIQLAKYLNEMMHHNPAEIEEILKDPNRPMIEIIVARGLKDAAKKGGYNYLSFLFDRAFGKVPDMVVMTEADSKDQPKEIPKQLAQKLLSAVNVIKSERREEKEAIVIHHTPTDSDKENKIEADFILDSLQKDQG